MTLPSAQSQHNYNVSQLRANTWNGLKHKSNELFIEGIESPGFENLNLQVKSVLDDLQIIEQYFAFPGLDSIRTLNGMLERQELMAFHNKVSDLVTILVSEAHRKDLNLLQKGKTLKDDLPKKKKDQGIKQKYFEVLFVDNIEEDEIKAIKKKLKSLRTPVDKFYYRLVHVRTFEDAMMALTFNPSIQACVIRYGLPYDSEHTNGICS